MNSGNQSLQRLLALTGRYGMVALLTVSAGVNISLARELRALKSTTRGGLAVGSMVPPIDAVTLDGRRTRIDFVTAQPTVLYYFSPTCGWCERNWTNVRHLIDEAATRFRFVGISTTADVAGFLEERDVDLNVVTGLHEEAIRGWRLGGTPHTIVVSPAGKVIGSWAGAYSGTIGREVEQFFGVKLPGLSRMAGRKPD